MMAVFRVHGTPVDGEDELFLCPLCPSGTFGALCDDQFLAEAHVHVHHQKRTDRRGWTRRDSGEVWKPFRLIALSGEMKEFLNFGGGAPPLTEAEWQGWSQDQRDLVIAGGRGVEFPQPCTPCCFRRDSDSSWSDSATSEQGLEWLEMTARGGSSTRGRGGKEAREMTKFFCPTCLDAEDAEAGYSTTRDLRHHMVLRHDLSFAKGTEFQWRDDLYAVPESYHPASQGDRDKSEKWGKDRTRRQKEREEKKRMASGEDEGKWKGKTLVKGQGTTGVGQSSRGGVMPVAGKRTREGDSVTSGASARPLSRTRVEAPSVPSRGDPYPPMPSLSASDVLADLAQPFATPPRMRLEDVATSFLRDAGRAGLNTPPMPQRMEVRATMTRAPPKTDYSDISGSESDGEEDVPVMEQERPRYEAVSAAASPPKSLGVASSLPPSGQVASGGLPVLAGPLGGRATGSGGPRRLEGVGGPWEMGATWAAAGPGLPVLVLHEGTGDRADVWEGPSPRQLIRWLVSLNPPPLDRRDALDQALTRFPPASALGCDLLRLRLSTVLETLRALGGTSGGALAVQALPLGDLE